MLLQQGKGGDMASAFGGGGSQAAFGARSGATVLSRATTVLALLFVVGALVLGIMGQRGPGSVVGGRRRPGRRRLGDHHTGSATNTGYSAGPVAPATPAPATHPDHSGAGEVASPARLRAAGTSSPWLGPRG